jgi:hypothetical protein
MADESENAGPKTDGPVKWLKPKFLGGLDLPRKPFLRRLKGLTNEREPFMAEWQDIVELVQPRRGRFIGKDANARRQPRTHNRIINNTGTIASRTLASGMMSGVSSPARPWFKLTTPDPDLMEFESVQTYLAIVAQRMQVAFAKSNFYNSIHSLYGDLGNIGNASMVIDEDAENIINCTLFAPGEYYMGAGYNGRINTVYREYSLSVMQMIEEWGKAVSKTVMNLYDRGNYDDLVSIVHAIEPNVGQIKGERGPRGMPFICAYFETAGSEHDDLLEGSGYHEWPAPSPRWDVIAGDTYGNGPGLDARGDLRALQEIEREKAKGIKKMMTPPVQSPTAFGNNPVSHMPGGVTGVTDSARSLGIRPIYEIPAQGINAVGQEIIRHEDRINKAFYADLFLMLAQSDRREITAREIEERHEEKLLALGPVLERLHNEALNIAVNRTFNIMARREMFPKAPKELEGQDLRVEYISILAQAQRAVAVGGIERLFGFVGSIAEGGYPQIFNKVDPEQAVDEYARMVGVPPKIVRGDEQVEAMKKEQAQKQAMAENVAAAGEMAGAADSAASAASQAAEIMPGAGPALLQQLGASNSGPVT